jgi:hypothetical protein
MSTQVLSIIARAQKSVCSVLLTVEGFCFAQYRGISIPCPERFPARSFALIEIEQHGSVFDAMFLRWRHSKESF